MIALEEKMRKERETDWYSFNCPEREEKGNHLQDALEPATLLLRLSTFLGRPLGLPVGVILETQEQETRRKPRWHRNHNEDDVSFADRGFVVGIGRNL